MRVESIVGGSFEVRGDRTPDEETIHAIRFAVVSRLVERDQDERVFTEILILEQRRQKVCEEISRDGDIAVVRIIGHIRRDEHVLRQGLVVEIVVERGEILDLARSDGVVGDRVEENERVMFTDILICAAERVSQALFVSLARFGTVAGQGAMYLVSRVWRVLLVLSPRNGLGIEQIRDGGDIRRQLMEIVIVHAENVAAGRGTVVRLRRVRQCEVVRQEDSLRGQLGEIRIVSGGLVVLRS